MKKKSIGWIIILVVLLVAASFIYAYFNSSADDGGLFAAKTACVSNGYQCGDCIDNDGDGKIDYKVNRRGAVIGDPQCASLTDDCESSVCCTPESDSTFCTRLGKTCGSVTANDNCGTSRTINCGTCSSGYTCTNGNCVINATCTNECSASGQKICDGNGYKTCGNYDADTCLEWSSVTNCLTGQTCTNGNCVMSNSCSDTDGGNFPQIKGNVSGYTSGASYSYSDICISNLTLLEYYCSGTYPKEINVTCSLNYTSCSDGKCI